jgi:PilZ domain-containing protein
LDSSPGRRAFRRFHLNAPVLFRWKEEQEHREVGCCANIGLGGLFVLSTKYPPLAAEVLVEVMLPAFDPEVSEVRINCVGRVIRTQQSGHLSSAGFAVAGSFQ